MIVSIRVVVASLLLVTLLSTPPPRADWINLTGAETSPNIAEIYIVDDHVKLLVALLPANATPYGKAFLLPRKALGYHPKVLITDGWEASGLPVEK